MEWIGLGHSNSYFWNNDLFIYVCRNRNYNKNTFRNLTIMLHDTPIKYFSGTHRVIPPTETFKNYENKLKTAGITRITDITDLDRIGIPVFSAIRPGAEEGSISVYSGKGIEKEQAKVSAMMEGFERYSGEKQSNEDIIIKTINEMKGNFITPESLNLPNTIKKEEISNLKIEWSKAIDIISEEEYYVPSNTIYHPYIPSTNTKTLFKGNTNGLASGNIIEEAILHGIFELTKKNYKQIAIDTIEDDLINNTINKFRENNINIKLMDLTADIGVTTIAASSDDKFLKDPALLTLGIGTHLDPKIAILRALTEVAQSRATQIHGAREDAVRADFMRKAGYERMKKINKHYFEEEENKINLSEIEDKSTKSI
ncbi:MAG: YcaO-related McrA-glycine thioamidation protein, partial [Methanobrevibacter sp.]|nr:YcaO-related McrA-glycine thioamidation protein [Methanobrevibacter sp.]